MTAAPRRDREAGVTLVEVLVVLAIVGVMAGVSMIGLRGAGRDATGEAEARRLADRLQLAADEALVTGVPRALAWDRAGYLFLAWDAEAGEWAPEAVPLLAAAHALPRGLALGGPEDGAPVLVSADRAGEPVALRIEGAGEPWVVAFDGLHVRASPEAVAFDGLHVRASPEGR